MSGTVLLDTNIVSAAFANQDGLEARVKTHASVMLPFIVEAELRYGAYHSGRPTEQLERVEGFVSRFPVLQPDGYTADIFGKIKAHLRVEGTMIPDHDIWIAALAKQFAMTVITRDAHFDRVPDLLLDHW